MKTISDLETMDLPQLKAIANDLQLNYAKNISKPKLVKLIFDVQQPDPDQIKQNEKDVDQAKQKEAELAETRASGAEEVDAILNKLEQFFEGELSEVGGAGEDGVVFSITNLAGEEVVKGTYSELVDKMAELEKIRAAEAFESAKNLKQAMEPIPAAELSVEENKGTPAPQAPEGWHKEIEANLKPFAKLGLKYTIENDTVSLKFVNRELSTTVHQPIHRITRIAETLLARV